MAGAFMDSSSCVYYQLFNSLHILMTMPVPLFLQKIWEYTPKIHIKIVDVQSPSKKQAETATFVRRQFERGMRHGYEQLKSQSVGSYYRDYGKYISTPERRVVDAREQKWHEDTCARFYDMETLDGSSYYLCQHGVHIK